MIGQWERKSKRNFNMINELRCSTFLLVILYFSKIQPHISDNLQNNGADFLSLRALAKVMVPYMY